jgi:hypothetical protein
MMTDYILTKQAATEPVSPDAFPVLFSFTMLARDAES